MRGQINRLLVWGMRTKQNFQSFEREKIQKLDFLFLHSTPRSFSFLFHFSLVAGLSLDFIYEIKVSQKMLLKVNFLTRSGKW